MVLNVQPLERRQLVCLRPLPSPFQGLVPCCRVFSNAIAAGGIVKAMRVPDGQRISNARLKAPKGDIASEYSRCHSYNCVKDLMGWTSF